MIETQILSRRDLESRFSQQTTLKEVIQKLEGEFTKSGRVICSVKVNGKRLSEADEILFGHTELSELEWIEVESEEPQELVEGTLRVQQEMIRHLHEHAARVAESYRAMQLDQGMGRLVGLLEGCFHLTEGLVALKSVRGALRLENVASWPKAEQEFRDVVQGLLLAIENKDYLKIADLIEFDFAHALDQWSEILSQKSDIIGK